MSILTRPVLVLNKGWTPIRTVSVEEAIKKLTSTYKNGEPKAKVILAESYSQYTWDDWSKLKPANDEDFIRTSSIFIKVPEVIFYTRYDKLPKAKVTFSRRAIFLRDEGICQYCSKKIPTEWTLDHINPRSLGGITEWRNVCLCCVFCNRKKANRTLKQAGMKLLKEPTVPKATLFKGNIVKPLKSWSAFLSETYWTVPLVD